jgi:hypothetical protein
MIRDVVNRDHSVSEDQDDKDEDGERKIAQKVHGGQLLSVKSFEVFKINVFPSIFVYPAQDYPGKLI